MPSIRPQLERPDFEGLFAAVRRRLGLALLCVLLVPAAAYAFSKTQDPEYTASAAMLFRDPPLEKGFPGLDVAVRDSEARRSLLTNVELASLDVVGERTAEKLPGSGLTGPAVSDAVGIQIDEDADVAVIEAKAGNAQLAADLANTFAREFVAFRRDADRDRIRRAKRQIDREASGLEDSVASSTSEARRERLDERLRTLRRRSRSLDLLAAVQSGSAEIIEPARVPGTPSSPQTKLNTALGGVLGLLLGVSLAFFVDRLDRRLRHRDEIEEAFGRPILASVPKSGALGGQRDLGRSLPAPEAEAFRSLRTNLTWFNADQPVRSVLVTSAAPGDGKTTTAWHLAGSAAQAGQRVLLIEADLRRPVLGDALGIEIRQDLAQGLTSRAGLEDMMERIALPEPADGVWAGGGHGRHAILDVIVSRSIPPNPADLLGSQRMHELIREAESQYDLVLIDTPPLTVVSDAVPLLRVVSGVLIVARLGHTARTEAIRLRDQLTNLHASALGVVVNYAAQGELLGYYGEGGRRAVAA